MLTNITDAKINLIEPIGNTIYKPKAKVIDFLIIFFSFIMFSTLYLMYV